MGKRQWDNAVIGSLVHERGVLALSGGGAVSSEPISGANSLLNRDSENGYRELIGPGKA